MTDLTPDAIRLHTYTVPGSSSRLSGLRIESTRRVITAYLVVECADGALTSTWVDLDGDSTAQRRAHRDIAEAAARESDRRP